MLLTVLGCSGSVPGPESPGSGYLVRAGDTTVALDLGNGTFGALQRYLDPFHLNALILSHLHPDHCADVSAMTVYRRYHPHPPQCDALPLYGPTDVDERLVAAYAPSADERTVTDLSDVYDFHPVEHPFRIDQLEVRAVAVDHTCEAYALRVSHAGRTLVYSGDTGPCSQLVELATGADVLLAEASWPD
ncbi:MAG: MBL fold metallo-hydrolase, partial [Pseudonocardiaceae bacterium]